MATMKQLELPLAEDCAECETTGVCRHCDGHSLVPGHWWLGCLWCPDGRCSWCQGEGRIGWEMFRV